MKSPVKPGDIFGKFRVLRQLGDGWLAERTEDFTQFGIVMLLLEPGTTADEVALLERRQKISQLDEPAVPKLIASTETPGGQRVNVFNFVEASPVLGVAQRECWALQRRLQYSLECLDALSTVHRSLLAYGNLTHDSFQVSPAGDARLAIVPALSLADEPVASDLRATVMFLSALWSECSPLPRDLRALLAKASAAGYSSTEEIARDVRAFLEHRPVSARAQTPLYRVHRLARRQPVLFAATLALAAVVMGATVQSFVQDAAARRARDQERQRLHQLQELTSALEINLYQPVHALPHSDQATASLLQWTALSLDAAAVEAGNDPAMRRELAQGYLRLAEMQRLAGDEKASAASVNKSRTIAAAY